MKRRNTLKPDLDHTGERWVYDFLKGTKAGNLLTEIRDNAPLVWNISNFVSMDIAANLLLSIGASPAMAHAIEEADSFSNICKAINGALTINIGTF